MSFEALLVNLGHLLVSFTHLLVNFMHLLVSFTHLLVSKSPILLPIFVHARHLSPIVHSLKGKHKGSYANCVIMMTDCKYKHWFKQPLFRAI
ncbi:hypothetical protein [Peribacillus simplex]|uniref:hypothetical protein n=1 Tax=Peribacillus simplex TaxID=1478 RepID=UPI00285370A0|nr:hypothetical protein [Peribacillus simplex]MDR4924956.1 hypothetical protein [Peribacillus simplex]